MKFVGYSYLIPLLPLIGAAINGLISFAGLRVSRATVYIVACTSIFLSFLLACGCLFDLSLLDPSQRVFTVTVFKWLDINPINVNVAFLIDPLSVVMMLVVTGISFLIHLYSTGYMHTDTGVVRFFSYLNLFCFAMLMLVMADNLLLMFVGWEGVGLCSYLLIAFWFEHKPNAVAGMKAFIVNRIGDFGFLIGILLLFWGTFAVGKPTFTFTELNTQVNLLSGLKIGGISLVTLVCLLLFFGATGKSAQIPLYVWLPDAMAGPTPVSALIHAATMVTAGVYLIGRLNFLYTISPTALVVVATVGALTAFFAATIGFAQNDIKKVLAYSTVSQLGYMFLGMGTGIYAAGIFHLVTHAFFKACLFLGAGCVILGAHHEQDIQKMGGLKKHMPAVYFSFLTATLALSGIFPLSGFFSKDEILWRVFSEGGRTIWFYLLWIIGLAGAFATAFYMFRCVALVFYGKIRKTKEYERDEADALETKRRIEPHFQPFTPVVLPQVMTGVVIVLAVLSVAGGFLGVPDVLGEFVHIPNILDDWLVLVFPSYEVAVGHGSALQEYVLMCMSVLIAISGIVVATWLYTKRLDLIQRFSLKYKKLYRLVLDKYRVDEFYDLVFVKNLLRVNSASRWFDNKIIDAMVNLTGRFGVLWSKVSGWWDQKFVDGAVNLVADATIESGKKLRIIQTGKIQHYFYIAMAGLLIAFLWSLFV